MVRIGRVPFEGIRNAIRKIFVGIPSTGETMKDYIDDTVEFIEKNVVGNGKTGEKK